MKTKVLIFVFLSVFNFLNKKKTEPTVLCNYEKGSIKIDKSEISISYDKKNYKYGEEVFVRLFIFRDKKIYIGSVDEISFNKDRRRYINEYEKKIKNDNTPLLIERINKRVFFFYYHIAAGSSFGHCSHQKINFIPGSTQYFSVDGTSINIVLFYNEKLVYAEKILRDDNLNLIKTIDILDEFYKQIPSY